MKKLFLLVGCAAALLAAAPAAAYINGSSTASNCGEAGNWIDLTFTTDEGVRLVDAWWDWNATGVWLDADGTSLCSPQNNGVASYSFYFDVPVGTNTQDFGLTATGFDSGDYFRFVMDLDMGASGSPFTTDYYGGTVTVEFSDGTILTGTFDEPYDSPNGATATFSNLATLPDLAWTTKPGWAAPMVPRPANDAVWTSVPAPTTLVGEADSTWINAACENVGGSTAMASRMNFHLDGAFLGYRNLWTIDPGAWNGPINYGPFNVRGGRHVIRVTADAAHTVTESDETNNVFAQQWCWQGDPLPSLTTATRAAPPYFNQDNEYATLSWHNCDGVRIVPDPAFDWCAVWAERLVDDGANEYMLRLHPASDSPTAAFGTNYDATGIEPERLQALLVNKHTFGSGPWDVGIIRFTEPSADYRIGHLPESPYPFDFGIDPETPYFASRLMMFQFHVGAGDLGPATLVARTDPADGPVHMGWLAPDFTRGDLGDVNDPVTTDGEGVATINLDLTATGDYCCVVWGNRSEHPDGLAVNVGLYGPRPDLETMTMNGWYAPVVPRPAPDALLFDCGLPDTLHGGQPLTWMNLAARNIGTADADTVGWGLDIDGGWDYGLHQILTLAPGGTRNLRNLTRQGTPWTVPGGRHTLALRMDYLDEVAESVECNNSSARQYCWSPAVLPSHGALTIADPKRLPPREGGWADCDGGGPQYWNCDGLRMAYVPPIGGNMHWVGTAVMPWTGDLDIDLQLHAPLAGTQSGFGPNVLATSASGAGQVDFVLVNHRFAPARAHDVGVLEDVDGNSPGYHVQEARSTFGGIVGPGARGPYAMSAGRMLNLHDFLLEAGTYLITLTDDGTGVDWGMSLYQDGMYHGKSGVLDGAIAWENGPGQTERMHVTVPPGTSCCLAVWKTDIDELAKDGSYLLWVAEGVSGVGDEVPGAPPASTQFAGAVPNPFNPQTVIAFDVAVAGPCRVAVHDLQGRRVRTLVDRAVGVGRHEETWDGLDDAGRRVASGVYVAKLEAAGARDLLKVTLVK
ncbi:MAG: hypothetical protein IH621_16210 [Krumholzibacteria bacterium]|nr:hypothetical protein [Candidatus Krumholzibacteria bacterium]